MANDHRRRRTASEGYEGSRIFSIEGCFFGMTEDLEA
jgi:hypothetical protein